MDGTLVDLEAMRAKLRSLPRPAVMVSGEPSARAVLLCRWGQLAARLDDHELETLLGIVEEDVAQITGTAATAAGG